MITEKDIKELYAIIGVLCDKVEYFEAEIKQLKHKINILEQKRGIKYDKKDKIIKVDFKK